MPSAGDLGENITGAVQIALGGFLKLATRSVGTDPGTPLAPALEAAYDLGRGEARSGRSMDALLAAYRVGARVAWREMSTVAAGAGMPAQTVAQFAELVFAYIDELSACERVRPHRRARHHGSRARALSRPARPAAARPARPTRCCSPPPHAPTGRRPRP